jgi:hypothetical protein
MVDLLRAIQDPFYPSDERDEIFSVLKKLWDDRAASALSRLKAMQQITIDGVDKLLRIHLADFFPGDYSFGAVMDTFARAKREVAAEAASVNRRPSRRKDTIFVVEGLTEVDAINILNGQLTVTAGGFYDSQISESIKNALLELMESEITQEEFVARTKKLVNDKLAGEKVLSDAYFERLANLVVMRVRNIGKFSAMKEARAKGYKLINPMDSRTSPVCRGLVEKNKIYSIEALEPVVTDILEATTPDEQKAAYPFWKHPDEDRPPIGPFHWGDCRTIIVPVFL